MKGAWLSGSIAFEFKNRLANCINPIPQFGKLFFSASYRGGKGALQSIYYIVFLFCLFCHPLDSTFCFIRLFSLSKLHTIDWRPANLTTMGTAFFVVLFFLPLHDGTGAEGVYSARPEWTSWSGWVDTKGGESRQHGASEGSNWKGPEVYYRSSRATKWLLLGF